MSDRSSYSERYRTPSPRFPQKTSITLARLLRCWERLRELDVDGYRTSKAAPPSTWLVEIEWADRHTRRSVGRGTTCSPFVTQAVAMALCDGDSEPLRPRLADGTQLPFLFSQLANGVLKAGVPAYERALAAWDATLADNEWPRPVIFFNLGYAVEPTELRRGDCVHIDWMSGGGHAVFCWDVHLNEHGEVDAFQYLSANGRMQNGGSGGGIAVGGTTDGTGGFIRRTDAAAGPGGKGDGAASPQYAAADPPLFRDDERYVEEGRWVTWDPEVASRPLSGLRRKPRKRPLLVKRVKAARLHGIDVSTIPLFAMGQDAPGPLVRPAAAPPSAPTLVPMGDALGHEEIALVQAQLRLLFRLGWIDQDPGRADGKLGPRTAAAVVAFQTAYGLPAAGELSELTRERLRSVCESARDAPSARQPQPQPQPDGAPVAFADEQPEPGPVQLYFRQGAARSGESVEVIARGTPLDIGRAALLLVEDGLSEAAAGPAAASIELYGERAAATVTIPERPPGTRLVARIAGTDIATAAPLTVAAPAGEPRSRAFGEPEAPIDPRLQRLEAAIAEVLLGARPLVTIASEAGVERDELLRWAVRYSDGGRQALGRSGAQPAAAVSPTDAPVATPPTAPGTGRSFASSDDSGPIERTLIISDLHLGNGGPYDSYAGGPELLRLLDSEATRQPTRVICNGDTVDFLLNTEPLQLSRERALACARALASHPETAAIFAAFGRVLLAGGEVVIRLGNHDAELGLREVQEVFRAALAQPPAVAARLIWQRGDDPVRSGGVLEVGGARVLVTHGEQNDPWNHLDYAHLPPSAGDGAALQSFEYPPGSRLVKTLLNPLKTRFQMRFADLLKPDFQGAVLTALAVNPAAVRTVFQGDTAVLLWQLFRRRSRRSTTFAQPEGDGGDLGLSERVQQAGLSAAEEQAIVDAVTLSAGPGGPGGGRSFAAPDPGEGDGSDGTEVREGALAKLARIGLTTYAAAHRHLAGRLGESYFDLAPDAEELSESRRLAQKFGVDVVIFGHTHAARFHAEREVVYLNTGTWIWLMQLPPADADLETWRRFLESLRRDPSLSTAGEGSGVGLMRRLHVARLEPHPDGGARVALCEWLPGRGLSVVREAQVRPRGKGA